MIIIRYLQSSNSPFHMDPHISHPACSGDLFIWQLFAMWESWNVQLNTECHSKSWMVKPLSAMTSSPGTNLFRMPQSCKINLSLARPPGNVHDESTGGNRNTVLYCVMRFVVTIRLSPPLQVARLLHDCLCAVQDTCGIRIPLEARWHCCFNYFPWKPHYQISQMNG